MASRGSTALDQAISAYLQGLIGHYHTSIPWLAEQTGIPYQSFLRYVRGQRAMGAADFIATLRVIGTVYHVAPEQAIAEIEALESALHP